MMSNWLDQLQQKVVRPDWVAAADQSLWDADALAKQLQDLKEEVCSRRCLCRCSSVGRVQGFPHCANELVDRLHPATNAFLRPLSTKSKNLCMSSWPLHIVQEV